MFTKKGKSAFWIKLTALFIVLSFAASIVYWAIPPQWLGKTASTVSDSQEAKLQESVSQLEAMIKARPTDTTPLRELGNTYFDWGSYLAFEKKDTRRAAEKFFRAIQNYQNYLKTNPDDPDVRTDLAACLFYLNQSEAALKELEKVIKGHPDHEPARFNYALTLEKMGRKKEAIQSWEEFLRLFPKSQYQEMVKKRVEELKKQSSLTTPSLP